MENKLLNSLLLQREKRDAFLVNRYCIILNSNLFLSVDVVYYVHTCNKVDRQIDRISGKYIPSKTCLMSVVSKKRAAIYAYETLISIDKMEKYSLK